MSNEELAAYEAALERIRDAECEICEHYCPANAGTIFSNSNVFNELR
jgi:Pyruvate/2-oxoacid:ferredoxin oxidoreductase delta subunit